MAKRPSGDRKPRRTVPEATPAAAVGRMLKRFRRSDRNETREMRKAVAALEEHYLAAMAAHGVAPKPEHGTFSSLAAGGKRLPYQVAAIPDALDTIVMLRELLGLVDHWLHPGQAAPELREHSVTWWYMQAVSTSDAREVVAFLVLDSIEHALAMLSPVVDAPDAIRHVLVTSLTRHAELTERLHKGNRTKRTALDRVLMWIRRELDGRPVAKWQVAQHARILAKRALAMREEKALPLGAPFKAIEKRLKKKHAGTLDDEVRRVALAEYLRKRIPQAITVK